MNGWSEMSISRPASISVCQLGGVTFFIYGWAALAKPNMPTTSTSLHVQPGLRDCAQVVGVYHGHVYGDVGIIGLELLVERVHEFHHGRILVDKDLQRGFFTATEPASGWAAPVEG